MRARHLFLAAPFLALLPAPAAAQTPNPAVPPAPEQSFMLHGQMGPGTGNLSPAPGNAVAFNSGSASPLEPAPVNGQRIAGFALIGVGAVGFTIGAIFGLQVSAKNRDIDAICPTGDPCPVASIADYNRAVADAKIDRAASLTAFGVGAIFVGTGAILLLTAPKNQSSGTALWLAPASSGTGASFAGTW